MINGESRFISELSELTDRQLVKSESVRYLLNDYHQVLLLLCRSL
jgi:hypothetical protein